MHCYFYNWKTINLLFREKYKPVVLYISHCYWMFRSQISLSSRINLNSSCAIVFYFTDKETAFKEGTGFASILPPGPVAHYHREWVRHSVALTSHCELKRTEIKEAGSGEWWTFHIPVDRGAGIWKMLIISLRRACKLLSVSSPGTAQASGPQ